MRDPDLPPEADGEDEVPVQRFDARQLGCRCDECDLRDKHPVPPELRPGSVLTVIAEAPGRWEVIQGRPLVGPSGSEMDRAVKDAGRSRADLSLDNVILCQIPGKGIDRYTTRLNRANTKRAEDGEPIRLHPLEACRPHLARTLGEANALLIMGKTALGALTGARTGEEGLGATRGFPMEVRGKPALATWHPAHVLRNRRWTEVFRSDVAKAFRNATGTLRWHDPPEGRLLFNPTIGQLDGALEAMARRKLVGADCETEPAPGREFDPEHDLLRCVALAIEGSGGNAGFGVSVGFRSVPKQHPKTAWDIPPTIAAERIRNFFARAIGQPRGPTLVMHNGNVYDRPVLLRHRMPLPDYRYVLDTLPASRNAWSELSGAGAGHGLDFLMSWLTDAPKHKGRLGQKIDHEAWESDRELAIYCMRDCLANLAIVPPILAEVRATEQGNVYVSDVQMQRFAVGAHRAGMKIDKCLRCAASAVDDAAVVAAGSPRTCCQWGWHNDRLTIKMHAAQATADAAVSESGLWRRSKPINLASIPQVREFLYDDLGLPWQVDDPEDEDPTTDRDAMYELLQRSDLPDYGRRFIEALLEHRGAFRSRQKDVRGLVIDPLDGRVHPGWGKIGTTGRPQSSDPNCSNIPDTKRDPDSMRSMYVAEDGCVLVYCDLEQVELRTVSLLAGDEIWLDLFRRQERGEKIDLHKTNASVFFDGKPADSIEPYERDYAKTLVYMYLYGGGARRAMINMRQVRNPKTGARPYATMTLKRAREARDKLLGTHYWLPKWWDRTIEEWRRDRYLREPILGRIRKFLDGEGGQDDQEAEQQRSELINFRAQASVASHMSGSGAVGKVMDEIGWPWSGRFRGLGGRGLIHHGYDSMMAEVAERHAEQARKILETAMTTRWTINGNTLAIPAKSKVGRRWSELA